MSPSNFFSQVLERACKVILNRASCFPAASDLLPGTPIDEKNSPARTISEYLKIVPIEGKGFGTVTRKDVDAYTLLFSESPAAIAQGDQLARPREMEYISQAYRRLTPGIKVRFDTLHEGSRPFQSRVMRIWKANTFNWDRIKGNGGKNTSAIFLDMSRINYSCLPNVEYYVNWEKEKLERFSNTCIRAGEEITICYGSHFDYRTGLERNAHLKCIYGFTCKCRACADPIFSVLSDRRRRMLKNDFYCGILGMPVAPDFSPKATGFEIPNSVQPAKIVRLQRGFADGSQIFRSGTMQLLRRAAKLRYDEGHGGDNLRELNCSATSSLCVMHKRMVDARSRVPVDPISEIGRCVQLLIASDILLRQTMVEPAAVRQVGVQNAKDMLRIWNVKMLDEITAAQARASIK